MRLVTAREMQEIDRLTIDGGHLESAELMENAGRATAREALGSLTGISEARVVVVCGKGNNGGDGLVVARHLAERGVLVRLYCTHAPAELSADARLNYARLPTSVDAQVLPAEIPDPGSIGDPRQRPRSVPALDRPEQASLSAPSTSLAHACENADLCIDALLGTGVSSAVRGRMAAIINTIGRHSRRTLAVDIPSGIDGDTGEVLGTAIWADVTVTFGLPKLGLVLFPGKERAGKLRVADIGFPPEIVQRVAGPRQWVEEACARLRLPRLEPTAHKYQRGNAVVIAGSRAYTGAAALAARAVLRSGAGIAHLIVPESVRGILQTKLTEAIVHGVAETDAGTSGRAALTAVRPLLGRARAVAIGSGLGEHPATRDWVRELLDELTLPAVVDADGLASLPPPPHAGARIVTPHAGELARWAEKSVPDRAAERLRFVLETAAQRQVILVAKGAPTVIATPDGQLFVNGSGNAGLATAGSGDVLTGILTGLLAQQLAPVDAAVLGVFLHGVAADVLAREQSPRSIVAGDLVEALGRAYRDLEPGPNLPE